MSACPTTVRHPTFASLPSQISHLIRPLRSINTVSPTPIDSNHLLPLTDLPLAVVSARTHTAPARILLPCLYNPGFFSSFSPHSPPLPGLNSKSFDTSPLAWQRKPCCAVPFLLAFLATPRFACDSLHHHLSHHITEHSTLKLLPLLHRFHSQPLIDSLCVCTITETTAVRRTLGVIDATPRHCLGWFTSPSR